MASKYEIAKDRHVKPDVSEQRHPSAPRAKDSKDTILRPDEQKKKSPPKRGSAAGR